MNSNIYNNLSLTKHNIRSSLWIIDPPWPGTRNLKKKVGDSTGWETSSLTSWKPNESRKISQNLHVKLQKWKLQVHPVLGVQLKMAIFAYHLGGITQEIVKVKFGFSSEKWIDCLPTVLLLKRKKLNLKKKEKNNWQCCCCFPFLHTWCFLRSWCDVIPCLGGNPVNSPFGNSHAFFFSHKINLREPRWGKKHQQQPLISTTECWKSGRCVWPCSIEKLTVSKMYSQAELGGQSFAAVVFFLIKHLGIPMKFLQSS